MNYGLKQQINHPMQEITLSGYDILEELGHGSQGQIFLARREIDGLPVAIKKLNIHSVSSWKAYDLFHREAEVLAKLDIDGVAKFYEAFDRLEDDPPCSYIVQEYIPGKSLAAMLKAGHRFTMKQVYDIIMQMLVILQQLHGQNVIHRDIKPSNIMLIPLDHGSIKVYLIDFGAVANPQVQGGGSTMAGTFGYMPPEQLMGKPEPASDIYALAAVAVYMITGKAPTDMPIKDYRLIFEPDMQSMPVAVVNTLRQMLEPDPSLRQCNYETLLSAFDSFQSDVYQDIQTYQRNIPAKDLDEHLKNVTAYGQPGNIDLWQSLDDVLPRKESCLPASYLNLETRPNSSFSDGVPLFEHTSFKKIKTYKFEWLNNFIKMFLILVVFIGLMFLAKYLDYWKQFIESEVLNTLFIIFGMICLIVLLVGLFWVIASHDFFTFQKEVKSHLQFESNQKKFQPQIKALLEEGRKTIATICSIDYIECSDEYLEHHEVDNIENQSNSKAIVLYAYHAGPLFKISYQFNPPDDEKKEDLTHYIYTSIAPEGHYQVGDPLPILYRIYKNECNRETVDSMPFPIPLDDISDDTNIIYHRTNEQLEAEEREQEQERIRQEEARKKFIQQQHEKEREDARQREEAAREIKRQAYQKMRAREMAKNKSYAKYSNKTVNARANSKGRRF